MAKRVFVTDTHGRTTQVSGPGSAKSSSNGSSNSSSNSSSSASTPAPAPAPAPVEYDKNTDYAALSASTNDPYLKSMYDAKRAAKIAGEGLDDKGNKITVPSSNSVSVSSPVYRSGSSSSRATMPVSTSIDSQIAQQQKLWQEANANNDYQGMINAATEADRLRQSVGQAAQNTDNVAQWQRMLNNNAQQQPQQPQQKQQPNSITYNNTIFNPFEDIQTKINYAKSIGADTTALEAQRQAKLDYFKNTDIQSLINNATTPEEAQYYTNLRNEKLKIYDENGNLRTTPTPIPTNNQEAVPQFKNPYAQAQDEVGKHLVSLLTSNYESPVGSQLDRLMQVYIDRINNPSKYDANTDQSLIQASKDVARQVAEEMNRRGILNSTITENDTLNAIASLRPQYEKLFYDRQQQQLDNQYKMIGVLKQMDDTAYNRYNDNITKAKDLSNYLSTLSKNELDQYKTMTEVYYKAKQEARESEKAQLDLAIKKIDAAWNDVKQRGYVSNEDSLILGVAPGTYSAEIQKEIRDFQADLKKKQKDYEIAMEKDRVNHEQQKEIIDYQANATRLTNQLSTQNQLNKEIAVEKYKQKNSKSSKSETADQIKSVIASSQLTDNVPALDPQQEANGEKRNTIESQITTLKEKAAQIKDEIGADEYNKLLDYSQKHYLELLKNEWVDSAGGDIVASLTSQPKYYSYLLGDYYNDMLGFGVSKQKQD